VQCRAVAAALQLRNRNRIVTGQPRQDVWPVAPGWQSLLIEAESIGAETEEFQMIVDIIAWIVLGAIAGWIAGLLVSGDEGLGVIGHIVLGIVGALVGGFVANLLGLGSGREGGDIVNLWSIIVAVIGAVIVVWVVGLFARRRTA
jgi:uncharacterized membrane protein YeaQ/YmgE (transglycosylase-associated protein family)